MSKKNFLSKINKLDNTSNEMKIKTLLVDDERENLQLLSYLLEKYIKDIQIVGVARNIDEALNLVETENPDLIFLDIELSNEETGFDLIDTIKDLNILTIIVTAYDHYGIKAIKCNVIDYILKPIDIVELHNSVERVRTKIITKCENTISIENQSKISSNDQSSQKENSFIAVPFVNEINLIEKKSILYLKSSGKYTEFFLDTSKTYISSRNMGEYDDQLSLDNFFRVHYSYLINLNQVKRIDKENGWFCIMKNDAEVPISRRRKEELCIRLNLK